MIQSLPQLTPSAGNKFTNIDNNFSKCIGGIITEADKANDFGWVPWSLAAVFCIWLPRKSNSHRSKFSQSKNIMNKHCIADMYKTGYTDTSFKRNVWYKIFHLIIHSHGPVELWIFCAYLFFIIYYKFV